MWQSFLYEQRIKLLENLTVEKLVRPSVLWLFRDENSIAIPDNPFRVTKWVRAVYILIAGWPPSWGQGMVWRPCCVFSVVSSSVTLRTLHRLCSLAHSRVGNYLPMGRCDLPFHVHCSSDSTKLKSCKVWRKVKSRGLWEFHVLIIVLILLFHIVRKDRPSICHAWWPEIVCPQHQASSVIHCLLISPSLLCGPVSWHL